MSNQESYRIYVGGIGGAPSNNFVKSLRQKYPKYRIIGGSSVATDLFLAEAERVFLVPKAKDPAYAARLFEILKREKPHMMHAQHDYEVETISRLRDEIHALGVKTFLPNKQTVETCVDKWKSYQAWEKAGLRVPKTLLIRDRSDLKSALKELGPHVWLRATTGAAGAGSLPTSDFDFAEKWIERFAGWGTFTAAEVLTPSSVTWSSIWYHGELIVCQTRRRLGWHSSDRALSGVTGMTAVGETCSDAVVTDVAQKTIFAIDKEPHGIFSVDMTYSQDNHPNPTEINIGRFFTTHYFFTQAGLNLPDIFCELCLSGKKPELGSKINPLQDGLVWIRGMDNEPALIHRQQLEELVRNGFMEGTKI
jgi:hypothetical protein